MKSGTIVAQSTPVGKGGIAIVRLSGPDAKRILLDCFVPSGGKRDLRPNELTLGTVNAGDIRDKAMAVFFRAPKSYTGEDLAEFHLHGSQEITDRVIKHLIRQGARLANPGEFTRRAFLSGKVSLNEAEAVGDLINAKSTAEINAAYSALKGRTAEELRNIYDGLLEIAGSFDAAVDYPEEDVEEMLLSDAVSKLRVLKKQAEELVRSYESGHKIRDGIRVALIGEPNAGKSSLMNRLLGKNRAIVTDVPGTTRDTIEESFEYRGLLFTLIDTAGIHETDDKVEIEGIKRTNEEGMNADIAVILLPKGSPDIDIRANVKLKIRSKSDEGADGKLMNVSSLTGEGIEELKEKLYELAGVPAVAGGGATLTNERQYGFMIVCLRELESAIEEAEKGSLIDIVSVGIKGALSALGQIIGANATEDVLDSIFSRFCVGK